MSGPFSQVCVMKMHKSPTGFYWVNGRGFPMTGMFSAYRTAVENAPLDSLLMLPNGILLKDAEEVKKISEGMRLLLQTRGAVHV
jgi:hypothetical protein